MIYIIKGSWFGVDREIRQETATLRALVAHQRPRGGDAGVLVIKVALSRTVNIRLPGKGN